VIFQRGRSMRGPGPPRTKQNVILTGAIHRTHEAKDLFLVRGSVLGPWKCMMGMSTR
jgi:hypothetical protein